MPAMVRKNVLALFTGLLISVLLLEVFLHIYNPFPFRLQGDRIVLPTSEKYTVFNTLTPKLEDTIIHSKNELGFRGPSPPANPESHLTILAVGGSTTECFYLSDGRDWPAKLSSELRKKCEAVWVNNAGLNGHSTFGHQILLREVLPELKPDIVLFLVGANEVSRSDLGKYDRQFLKSNTARWKNTLTRYSEILSLVANLRRVQRARQQGFTHNPVHFESTLELAVDSVFIKKTIREQEPYLQSYGVRLSELLDFCRQSKCVTVVMSQPMIGGEGLDPESGADLERIIVNRAWNGATSWAVQQAFNEVTAQIASNKADLYLDLGTAMPKSSALYYDFTHYTDSGAAWISHWLSDRLDPFLRNNFQDYCNN